MTTNLFNHCMVYCTCPDNASAERLANVIIDEKVAACVNVIPQINSVYHWKGVKENGTEILLLIKTRVDRFAKLEQVIKNNHPYELPEVVAVPILLGSKAYLDWLDENVTA